MTMSTVTTNVARGWRSLRMVVTVPRRASQKVVDHAIERKYGSFGTPERLKSTIGAAGWWLRSRPLVQGKPMSPEPGHLRLSTSPLRSRHKVSSETTSTQVSGPNLDRSERGRNESRFSTVKPTRLNARLGRYGIVA